MIYYHILLLNILFLYCNETFGNVCMNFNFFTKSISQETNNTTLWTANTIQYTLNVTVRNLQWMKQCLYYNTNRIHQIPRLLTKGSLLHYSYAWVNDENPEFHLLLLSVSMIHKNPCWFGHIYFQNGFLSFFWPVEVTNVLNTAHTACKHSALKYIFYVYLL